MWAQFKEFILTFNLYIIHFFSHYSHTDIAYLNFYSFYKIGNKLKPYPILFAMEFYFH